MDHLAAGDHLLQDPEEFTAFCELLKKERVESYLEIGSWSGGSIQMVAKYLPKGSRLVSVDLGVNRHKHEKLFQVLNELQHEGHFTYLCSGDSTDEAVIRRATKLSPYDAVFIDGCHMLPFVQSDWDHYGQLARIVGFHDIAVDKPPHGVCRFWQQLKTQYRHVEFISEETRNQVEGYGIGVVWRDARQ